MTGTDDLRLAGASAFVTGTPDEVARACVFLCSAWAAYVTGHTLDVNDGQVMR